MTARNTPTPLAPTPVPVADITVDLDEWFLDSDDEPHAECCARPEFLCGAPYHPEASAASSHGACPACVRLVRVASCPSWRNPNHFHCPLSVKAGLFTFCSGPKTWE